VVLTVVFAVTGFLTYYYGVVRPARAEEYYQQGSELLEHGSTDAAIERYRNALSISHSSEHRLALGLALVSGGRLDEARIYLREVLSNDPGNGPANLGMARVEAKQRQVQEAARYYHAAIEGAWPEPADQKSAEARFELVDLLGNTGRTMQALMELPELRQQTEQDTAAQKRIGALFLRFGAAKDSGDVFRELVRRNDRDAEAYKGLGQAEFALEHYPSAADSFRHALERNPSDETAREQLRVAEEILALDPTLRGLSSAERYKRSLRLVEGALRGVEQCGNRGGAELPVEAARKALSARGRPRSYSDAAEDNLALAEQLWAARQKSCQPGSEALERVFQHLLH